MLESTLEKSFNTKILLDYFIFRIGIKLMIIRHKIIVYLFFDFDFDFYEYEYY